MEYDKLEPSESVDGVEHAEREATGIAPTIDYMQKYNVRNFISFWFFGFGTVSVYGLTMTAAADILHLDHEHRRNHNNDNLTQQIGTTVNATQSHVMQCSRIGTGVVLLSTIIPILFVKIIGPWTMGKLSYWIRTALFVVFMVGATSLIGIGANLGVRLLGTVFSGMSEGFGETSYLGLTSHFHPNTITAFTSGMGVAAPVVSLSYSFMRQFGVTYMSAILIGLVIPAVVSIAYIFVFVPPSYLGEDKLHPCKVDTDGSGRPLVDTSNPIDTSKTAKTYHLPLKEKLQVMKVLLKYMIPVALVYFEEYYIGLGLQELLYFENVKIGSLQLDRFAQYRWMATIYAVSAAISRTFGRCIRIDVLWIYPVLQGINMVFLICQVIYQFLPSVWIVFIVFIWEGLIGGTVYLNTFHQISEDMEERHREFALSAASVAEAVGVTLAAVLAYFTHDLFCGMNIIIRH